MGISNLEKIKLVMAKDFWTTEDLDGTLGYVKVSDGPVGLRCLAITDSWENDSIYPSTAYPCYQMLGQTWNPELAHKMGRAIADDCIDHDVDVLLGPGINIKRTPLCGRNFEYYSEDPLVAGKFAAAKVRGIQSTHTAASPKHFAANNKETKRYYSDSRMSERALREIYLKSFEICVKESKPWTVMTSYNILNARRTCESFELIAGILRQEWGYDGMVITDWHGPCNQEHCIIAGNDVRMPLGIPDAVSEALRYGRIRRGNLEVCVKRILEMILKLD